MVVNIIAHMGHSPPIHNDCFVNKDFIIIIIIIIIIILSIITIRSVLHPVTSFDQYYIQ